MIIYIILGVAGLMFLVFIALSIKIVRPTDRAVVETLGKYSGFRNPGLAIIIPFIQRIIRVNTTEQMADIRPQEIITEDNLNAKVDMVVYFQVKSDEESVKRSLYNVNNFSNQIIVLGYFIL